MNIRFGVRVLMAVAAIGLQMTAPGAAQTPARLKIPTFEYDPSWPKPLPGNWLTGPIGALAIDAKDHIWVAQRPGGTTNLSERYGLDGDGHCCYPAPPVLEFDPAGNLIQSWGPIHDEKGALLGKQVWGPNPNVAWPLSEHGIFVDHKDNVWVDSQNDPSQVLKLTRDGKLLMRLGKQEAKSSNDTANFAGPTGILVDPKTNEVYIADGYRNRRVIVFDAETGAYKRHWGAYGKRPPDGPQGGNPIEGPYDPKNPLSQNFATVHCITQSRDGILYVCDRVNNRIQSFKTDGTFLTEVVVTQTKGFGAVHAIAFSPDKDQRFMYVGDGANKKVWILTRADMKVVGSFGRGGRAGGQFLIVHALVVDSKGNLYVGETINNNRVQKFRYVGMK